MKGAPTLKGAFTAGQQDCKAPPHSKETKEKKKGKTCTGYFGCQNIAAYHEASGTAYCRIHKPKHVQTSAIQTDKPTARKVPKK